MDRLIAEAGTPVTCENGHRIAVVAKDIRDTNHASPNDFKDWSIPEPQSGDLIPPCPTCGAEYIRLKQWAAPKQPWWRRLLGPIGWTTEDIARMSGGMEMHTPQGWR